MDAEHLQRLIRHQYTDQIEYHRCEPPNLVAGIARLLHTYPATAITSAGRRGPERAVAGSNPAARLCARNDGRCAQKSSQGKTMDVVKSLCETKPRGGEIRT